MIRLLKFLLTGDWHLHRWKTISTDQVFSLDDDGGKLSALPTSLQSRCRCEICGVWKTFKH